MRIEDVVAMLTAAGLVAYAGLRSAIAGIVLDEGSYWDFNFVLAPAAILVFAYSLRYALGLGRVATGRTLRTLAEIVRDWSPFLFFLLTYAAFHTALLQQTAPQNFDAELLAVDRWLLGESPAVMMQSLVNPLLTEFLSFSYFLHLVLPPILAVSWYLRNRKLFREYLLAILLCAVFGAIGYALVPAVGPGEAFPHLFPREITGEWSEPIMVAVDAARSPQDVFPSLHIAVSTVVLVFAFRRGRWWFWAMLPFVVGNWVSTLYLRYHYFIDDIAGWILAIGVLWMARSLLNLETRLKERWGERPATQDLAGASG
jgi:membrane-associated phospholipid phosphatase